MTEKHPIIETLWVPKQLKRLPFHRDTESTTGSSNDTHHSTDTAGEEGSPSRHNHHRHRLHLPRIRNLLAALSFERHDAHPPEPPPSPTPPHKTSNVHRGSLLVDSEVEIFYDALEYGNSPTKDDFLDEDVPRESIVLAGITAYIPTLEEDADAYDHVVETVLDRTPPSHDKLGHKRSVEYTEEEYQSNSLLAGDSAEAGSETSSVKRELFAKSMEEGPPLPPPPPTELPLRFLRAGKNDPVEGVRRYQATLQMRQEQKVDTILRESSPEFLSIKQHYPHFCHYRGKNNEPCFYEQPPKTNLKALRANGVTLDKLLRHYTMVTEYQWQFIERDDLAKSIYIIDLDGIRMTDFVGEAVDFVKKAAAFSAQHYPERAGYVFVINVPGWFKMIWGVVKPIIDEDTLKKIYILRGVDEIRTAMQERIPLEHIPPEYGGNSLPLGQSPQEQTLAEWMEHNNRLAEEGRTLCRDHTTCQFCTWVPARSY